MTRVSFYDTKPYDRDFFTQANASKNIGWDFHDFRLDFKTANTARGSGVVCAFVNDQLNRECLEVLSSEGVKLIALRSAGYNHIDLVAAKDLGMSVTRVPEYSPYAVAEYAIGLLLTLNRRIHRAHNRVRELNFCLNGLMGFDIHGKTVGIVGTGKIGKVTAEIFRGFGATVLAYDTAPSVEWAASKGIVYKDFKALLKSSDIISLHVPLTPEVFHLFNSDTFSLMKHGAYLINTSRGKLVDTRALIDRIKLGHLGGVALDVYEEEEGVFFQDHSSDILKDDNLLEMLSFPNVLITSHQAFFTREAMTEIARVTVENILRMEKGTPYLEGTVL